MTATNEPLSLRAYQEIAQENSWFLQQDASTRKATIYFGLTEELDEITYHPNYPNNLTAMFWGRPVHPTVKSRLGHETTGEGADLLYYYVAGAMLRNNTLTDIARVATEVYGGKEVDTLQEFDICMSDKLEPPMPNDYQPDYSLMQMYNSSPFKREGVTVDWNELIENKHKGPLVISGDSLYALERTGRFAIEHILPPKGNEYDDNYMLAAGLALGALSAVLQNRFDSSLEDAAHRGIAKMRRRAAANTQTEGQDIERSRPQGKVRERLTGFDVTISDLIPAGTNVNPAALDDEARTQDSGRNPGEKFVQDTLFDIPLAA